MKRILVIGASGFTGGHLARALRAEGLAVRCLARNPAKVRDLDGCEIVQGDISDPASLLRALDSVEAVYVSVQTLSPQPGSSGGFMDIEKAGLQNIVAAARANGVRRLISVTSLGITRDAESVWLRERWQIEQFLLTSGLEVTILHPGQIVGRGGRGFEMTMSQARSRFALVLGSGRSKMRNIALGDLIYYLTGALSEPRSFGNAYDVGGDDVLSGDEMIDIAADVLGRPHPVKFHIPLWFLAAMAPLIERMGKLPKGAITGIAASLKDDGIGDPMPIRAILPRPPLAYRDAVAKALQT
jgi:uncharacterized protein YbjT (DUF2867 family)